MWGGDRYDTTAQAPFFNYYDAQGDVTRCGSTDARSIQARMRLVAEYGLAGVSFWTINQLFRTNFLVIQSMYGINKVVISACK